MNLKSIMQEFGSCTVNLYKYQSDDQTESKDVYMQLSNLTFVSCSSSS